MQVKAAFEPNHSVSYQKLSAVTFANLFGHPVGVGLDPPKRMPGLPLR